MSERIIEGPVTADRQDEVTVFLIGMRVNSFRRTGDWLPPFRAMRRMLTELDATTDSGLLGHRTLLGPPRLFFVVQYWSSHEKLIAYASDTEGAHHPAWAAFNRQARKGGGGVGIWHETFVVPAGAHEQVYRNMPADFGLGGAVGVVPVERRGRLAAERLAGRKSP